MLPPRAVHLVDSLGILQGDEVDGTRKVLGGSSPDLCGSSGRFHFTACAADHPVWRTQTK